MAPTGTLQDVCRLKTLIFELNERIRLIEMKKYEESEEYGAKYSGRCALIWLAEHAANTNSEEEWYERIVQRLLQVTENPSFIEM